MNRHELDAARRRTLQQDALAGLPLRALDIAALMTLPEPTIDWVWDGYIETATVAQLHGNGGAGKSILAMALVRAAAGGYDLLGRRTFPARAVIVDGENPTPELHRRLHRLDYAAISDMVSYQQVDDAIFADLAKSELALCELAESARSDLMVLDSQRALWPGDENEAQGVRPFYMMLRRVANQTGTAVLVVHHDNKNGGYSGSSDLNAGVDSRLHLIRDDDGRIELRHEKLRCDVEQPTVRYRLGVEDGRYAFTMDEVRTARSDVLSALGVADRH